MEKKSKLNGFSFKLIPEIASGLMIPTGNEIRPIETQPPEPIISPFVGQMTKPLPEKNASRTSPIFKKIDIDNSAFSPMTNVVPTIMATNVPTIEDVVVPNEKPKFKGLTRRQKQRVTHQDLDLVEFAAQPTIGDKMFYLSMRGWSLKVVGRGNGFYRHATKYVRRIRNGESKSEKKSIYLGSVNRDLSESITIKSISI